MWSSGSPGLRIDFEAVLFLGLCVCLLPCSDAKLHQLEKYLCIVQSGAGVKGGRAAQRPACSIPVGTLQHDHQPPTTSHYQPGLNSL
ncbi:unnamed protein product [Boreogadus saida]